MHDTKKKKITASRLATGSGGWLGIEQALASPFWTQKGLAANCPFCGAASDQGKMRFLISVTRSEDRSEPSFKGYLCFVCGESGAGRRGLLKLFTALGFKGGLEEIESLSGTGRSGGLAKPSPENKESGAVAAGGESALIEWPPPWAESSGELRDRTSRYLRKRGVGYCEKLLESSFLVASEAILSGSGELIDYPSILAPVEKSPGEVVGWIARRIPSEELGAKAEEKKGPSLPDKMSMDGGGWRREGFYGLSLLDPGRPVTLVEGLFSALATPNAVAMSGKHLFGEQARALERMGVALVFEALDPDASESERARVRHKFKMSAPSVKVFSIDWSSYDVRSGEDAADLGRDIMTLIINDSLQKLKKK